MLPWPLPYSYAPESAFHDNLLPLFLVALILALDKEKIPCDRQHDRTLKKVLCEHNLRNRVAVKPFKEAEFSGLIEHSNTVTIFAKRIHGNFRYN